MATFPVAGGSLNLTTPGGGYAFSNANPILNTAQPLDSNFYSSYQTLPTLSLAPTQTQTTSGSGTTSGTSSVAAPAPNPNQPLIDLLNGSLSRLPNQLQIAKDNVQHQYDTNLNTLNSGHDAAQQQYNQSTTQNQQQYRLNKNQIADQASTGLSSLMRLLGAHGAGGSSDAQFVAPHLVAEQASQQRAGAGQTYGDNAQNLDTNFNTYNSGFTNSKKQLNDWLSQNLQSAEANSKNTEAGLNQQLLGMQTSVAAAQPFVDKINSLSSDVDNLGKFNPTYDGTTPTYTAPSINSYVAKANGVQQPTATDALQSSISPFFSLLLGQNKKQQNNVPQF